MREISYEDLSNKCKNIIKTKPPDIAINMIANLKTTDGKTTLGISIAKKIYKLYGHESVPYSSAKYGENISSYQTKVKNNIKKACGKEAVSNKNNKFSKTNNV